jgi:hypothetical protein
MMHHKLKVTKEMIWGGKVELGGPQSRKEIQTETLLKP